MNQTEALDVIKNTFYHLIFEENIKVGTTEVLLYFPTMGIAILESSENKSHIDSENVEHLDEHLIRKELDAEPIYLDMDAPDFSIGFVLNEILLQVGFVPKIDSVDERKGMN